MNENTQREQGQNQELIEEAAQLVVAAVEPAPAPGAKGRKRPAPAAAVAASSRTTVPLSEIREDPDNARLTFDAAGIKALADTIRDRRDQGLPGLVYPVPVRPHPQGGYVLVDGARRYRAHQLLKLKEIDVDIQDLSDKAAATAAALANLQREDLSEYEQARAFQRLLDLSLQKKEICERAGVAFNTLKARLQLLELPDAVAKKVGVDGFTNSHAQLVLPFAKDAKVLDAALKAIGGTEKEPAPTLDVARARVVERLVADKLVVNVDEASGLGNVYGGPEKARLEKVRKATKAFTLKGAGKYGGDAHIALATPEVLEATKASRAHEAAVRKKRNAAYGYSSKPESAETREARLAKEALERDARSRAEENRAVVLLEKAKKLTSRHAVDILADRWGDQREMDALAKHLGVELPAPTPGQGPGNTALARKERDAVGNALAKLPFEDCLRTLLAMKLSRTYEYDREGSKVVEEVTGKKWSDWLSAAKVQIREEAKKAKNAAKSTPVMGTNVRVPHDDADEDIELDGAVDPDGEDLVKPRKAKKAKAQPAKPDKAKAPVKGAAASLAKARAKLAATKGKQAKLA